MWITTFIKKSSAEESYREKVRNLLLKLAEMFKIQLVTCRILQCVGESLYFLNDGGQAVVEEGHLGGIEVEAENSLEMEGPFWTREDLWVLGEMEEEGGGVKAHEKDRDRRTACVKTWGLD